MVKLDLGSGLGLGLKRLVGVQVELFTDLLMTVI